jgi:NAD(P)-dependent dehydrogenase (short-subunit alcohol dehydrogenase family)
MAHRILSAIDIDDLHSAHRYNRVAAYGRSKLANLLFIYGLQRRLDAAKARTIAVAAHPGVSATELMRNMPGGRQLTPLAAPLAQNADAGALPTLRAATDPAAQGGEYFGPDGFMELRGNPVLVRSSERSHDRELQEALWAASEEQTGVVYPV